MGNTIAEADKVESFLSEQYSGNELEGILKLAVRAHEMSEGSMVMAIGIVAMRYVDRKVLTRAQCDKVLKMMDPS